MSSLTIVNILLPTSAACAYLYWCDPRGHVMLLAALCAYAASTVQEYYSTDAIITSLLHALLALAVQTLLVLLATAMYRLSPLHPLASFPGSALDKLTGLRLAALALTGKRAAYVSRLHAKYGTIVRIGPNKLSINSLDAIHPIYASAQAFDKANSYRPGRTPNNALFFLRGKVAHNRPRRLWAGALTNAAISEWDKPLEDRTSQLIECIERRQDASGIVDLTECLQHWAFDFGGDWAFGEGQHSGMEFMRDGDPTKVIESSQEAIVLFEAFGEVPAFFDIITYLPVNEAYNQLERYTHVELKKRLKSKPQNGWDLFSFLLAQRDENPYPPLAGSDLPASAAFAFSAGGDTTAGFASVTMFYLLNNRKAYEKLKRELDFAFPSGEILAEQHASLSELPYLSAVVKEGLRLGAAFPGFPRVVPSGGSVLAGKFIPEGTIVGVPTYTVHTDPRNFSPEPHAFRPERWFKDGLGPQTVTRQEAFMAFQSGPFSCVGKELAYREMNVVFSRLVLAYDLEFAPDFDPKAFLKGWSNMRTNVIRYHLRVQGKRRQR